MPARMGVNQLLSTEIQRAVNRVTLEMRIGSPPLVMRLLHTLLVNPGDISESISSKSQTIETLGGNYVEAWGRGAGTLTIQGITGFHKRIIPQNGNLLDGYEEYKRLRKFVEDYLTYQTDNRRPDLGDPVPTELRIHFWEDDEHLIVNIEGPEAFKKLRSESRPLLYAYSLSMKVLGPVGSPLERDLFEQAAGYQRAQAAIQSMGEAHQEINRWMAFNGVGFQAVAKPMYDEAIKIFNSIDELRAGATSLIQGSALVAGMDILSDAISLVAAGKALLFDTVQSIVVDEIALGLLRPLRRAVCAAQNFAGSMQEADTRARNAMQTIGGAFASVGRGSGC